jgi:hypothetical protein
VPVWVVVAALIGWGLWQASQFMREVSAEVGGPRLVEAAPAVAASTEQAGAVATTDGASDGGTGVGDVIDPAERVTAQEWALATTPAGIVQENLVGDAGALLEQSLAAEHAEVSGTAEELMARGTKLLDAGRIVEGRAALNGALVQLEKDPRGEGLRQELTALNAGIFLGSTVVAEDPAAKYIEIQPGDSFLKLGRRFSVPAALLEAINPGLNPRNLRPLTGMKVVQGPFHLRVFKSAKRVDLYARDLYVQSFAGLVEEGNYLPSGTYRVSAGSKIRVGQKVWVGIEGVGEGGRDMVSGWLYGEAGPRGVGRGKRSELISGVKIADADLWQLYNVLVEGRSLVRVEP